MIILNLLPCASLPAISEDVDLCSQYLNSAAGLGFRGIEVKLGRDDLISSRMRKWLEEALPSYDFTIYAHLPYLHGSKNLASPDQKKASFAMEVMLESIKFSAGLGCTMVNTHLGVKLGDGPHIPRATSRLLTIIDESGDLGVEVSVENQESNCNGIVNTPGDVNILIDSYPDVQLTYDAGHGKTHGYGVADFMPVMIDRLSYLHLHDNNGGRDEHLALGRGKVNFPLLMGELGKCRMPRDPIPVTLELAAQDLGPSLEYLYTLVGNEVVII